MLKFLHWSWRRAIVISYIYESCTRLPVHFLMFSISHSAKSSCLHAQVEHFQTEILLLILYVWLTRLLKNIEHSVHWLSFCLDLFLFLCSSIVIFFYFWLLFWGSISISVGFLLRWWSKIRKQQQERWNLVIYICYMWIY